MDEEGVDETGGTFEFHAREANRRVSPRHEGLTSGNLDRSKHLIRAVASVPQARGLREYSTLRGGLP
jgi:hypothetical protein